MIQFLSVTKAYDNDIYALQEMNFEIQEGEFVFMVGPSGSGKTTIIKLLIREELPSLGQIYFDDEDITKFKTKQIYQLRRKIGVIFQDYKLINDLTAYENISFVMEAAGQKDKEIKENVPYLLDIVGLSHRMNAFPYQLSGGEKQRVAIARAMANNPKLLIADEPTGNLDPDTSWDIAQILYKINNWGTTVLMSTHGSDIVNSMHKRVLRLKSGILIRDDFKGSYEDIDDFSMKIIESQQEKEPIKIQTKDNNGDETEQKKVDTQKKKLKQTSKKISFSTKNKKDKAPSVNLVNKDEEVETFEKKVEESEEKVIEEAATEKTEKVTK